jgi:8-oxo-dGTP diphosphatase
MRRYGEAVVPGQHYGDRPGAYACIGDGTGNLLLAATTVRGEEFLLPGGGIDPGENPLQALHREVMEETGWRVGHVRRMGAFQRYVYMPEYDKWARKVCHVYVCRGIAQLADPIEPDHTPVWIDGREAVENLSISGDRAFVAALVASGISF